MEYKIEKTDETPEVIFTEKSLTLAGRSLPENVTSFYSKIMQDLKEVNQDFTFNIKLEYFNTATSKIILDMLYILEEKKINTVNWYYDQDDEDMFDAGVEYSELVEGLKFNFIIFT